MPVPWNPSLTVPNCVLMIGNRGSGKTTLLENLSLLAAKEQPYAVVSWDWPGTYARRMVGHLSCEVDCPRPLYDAALPTDNKCLSWPYYLRSTSEDPLVEEVENELADEEFAQAFWSKRNKKTGEGSPYTNQYLMAAIRVWRSQLEIPHLTFLAHTLRPGQGRYRQLLDNAGHRQAKETLLLAEHRANRSPIQYEREVGATQRLIQIVESPVIWMHNGNSLDWRQVLLEKRQVYFDLSGVSQEAARALVIFGTHAIINACRRYFKETGKPLLVMIVLEEAGFLGLTPPSIIASMQADRKAGVGFTIISQTCQDFFNPEQPGLFDQIASLCDEQYYFRINSDIDKVASLLAAPTFNPLEVHYRRERVQFDGYDEIRQYNTSDGESIDHLLHKRKDIRKSSSVSYRARYAPVTDEFYKQPQVHEAEFKQKLSSLQTFEYFVRDAAGVRRERTTPLGDVWPLGLSEIKIAEEIAWIRRLPYYQPPRMPEPLPEPPKNQGAASRMRGKG